MAPEVSAGDAGGQGTTDHGAGLPARILDVATRLFAEHGWAGTSVRAVADAAECTPPALYYHFGGKEALWMASVEHCFRRLGALQMAVRRAGGTVREQLVASLRATIDLATREPHVLWLLYRAARHAEEGQPPHPLPEHRSSRRRRTVELIQRGIDSGELRPDIDPEIAVNAIYGAVDYRLGELFYEDRPIEERWVERTVDHLFRGLEA